MVSLDKKAIISDISNIRAHLVRIRTARSHEDQGFSVAFDYHSKMILLGYKLSESQANQLAAEIASRVQQQDTFPRKPHA